MSTGIMLKKSRFNNILMAAMACNEFERKHLFQINPIALFRKAKKLLKSKEFTKTHISSKVLFSACLPWHYSTKIKDVIVQKGILVSGVLNKGVINRMVQEIYISFSKWDSIKFINSVYFVCNLFNSEVGYSFRLQDCENTESEKILSQINTAVSEAANIYNMPKTEEEKETLLYECLNKATQIGEEIAKGGMVGKENNSMSVATISKAKGSFVNLAYISCFLGQQTVDGERMGAKLCNGKRMLSCFQKDDNSIHAHGFVKNNFYKGLNPYEVFFHAWSARKGLIDTSVSTQQSGHANRQFAKKMEGCKVATDGTVVDCDGTIVCFNYGVFNFDPSEVCWIGDTPWFVDFKILAERINNKYEYTVGDIEKVELTIPQIKSICNQLIFYNKDSKTQRQIKDRFFLKMVQLLEGVKLFPCVVCLQSFIIFTRNKFYKALIKPGNMVGFKASCAAGESGTQAVLNAFHQSGTSSKTTTTGLPRMQELCAARKRENVKLKSCSFNCTTKFENKQQGYEWVNNHRKEFECTFFEQYCLSSEIEKIGDKPTNEYEEMLNIHNTHTIPDFVQEYCDYIDDDYPEITGFAIIFYLNYSKLYEMRISPAQLVEKFDDDLGFACVSKDLNDNRLIVYPYYDGVKKFDITANNWEYLYTREKLVHQIENTMISGIVGIEKMYYVKENLIDLQGTNFARLMYMNHVHFASLMSDLIWDIYECLGIDATQIFLYEELTKCSSKKMNPGHLILLSCVMTKTGELTSVSESGIDIETAGVLAKASFEKPMPPLFTAGVFGKHDDGKSVASNYYLGNLGDYGTHSSSFQLLNNRTGKEICV